MYLAAAENNVKVNARRATVLWWGIVFLAVGFVLSAAGRVSSFPLSQQEARSSCPPSANSITLDLDEDAQRQIAAIMEHHNYITTAAGAILFALKMVENALPAKGAVIRNAVTRVPDTRPKVSVFRPRNIIKEARGIEPGNNVQKFANPPRQRLRQGSTRIRLKQKIRFRSR